jgi:hypothetical protein
VVFHPPIPLQRWNACFAGAALAFQGGRYSALQVDGESWDQRLLDGEIKRTGVRRLPAVAKRCLHIGFFTLRWPLEGAAQGGPPPLENFSPFISIFEALAPAMCVDEDYAVCTPSCALMRFDAIDDRQLLYELIPTSIVA